VPVLGLAALPLSTALGAWLNALALYFILQRRGHYRLQGATAFRVARQLLAALAMGAALYGMMMLLGGLLDGSKGARVVALAALVAVGPTVYFGVGWVIGAVNRADVMTLLRRKNAKVD
jgi:putative peptidoglycan lipid II flippase